MTTYTIQDLANSKGVSQPVREALLHMEAELAESRRINAELLEALNKIERTIYHVERPPIESLEEQMRRIARAAIAKATGEQA